MRALVGEGVAMVSGDGRARGGPSRRLRSFSPWHGSARSVTEIGVLVVDPQRVSQRFVELALATTPEFQLKASVESASDAASAFEILKSSLVDVILTESDLPDMSGLRFCRLLRQAGRLQDIPLIFLSADERVGTRVVALRAGADDYLVKPCDKGELCARISLAVSRRLRETSRRRDREYTLAGDFGTLSLPDLVSILEVSRRTGVLAVATARAMGEVLFDTGRIVHAAFGNLGGVEAFYRMMDQAEGQFEFTAQTLLANSVRSIDGSVAGLLMEGARRLDERQHGRSVSEEEPPKALGAGSRLPHPTVVRISERPLSPLAATSELSTQFELAIADEVALGELMFLDEKNLSEWTSSELGRARLHVHLIADLSAGITSLLAMASPPSERSVRAALQDGGKALVLAFFLRHELLVDVVLMDIRHPSAMVGALRRSPAITLLAPSEGDPLSLGPTSLVELDELIRRAVPSTLVWVAKRKPESLVSWPAVATLHVAGALDESATDLRELLVKGVRFWAKTLAVRPSERMA